MTKAELFELCKKHHVQFLDLKFTDMVGCWHHFTLPIIEMTDTLFEQGAGFDGSSIRGFQSIDESDMLLRPDLSTAFLDPFCEAPTISMIGDVVQPPHEGRSASYDRDPRHIARKSEEYLIKTGLADTVYLGPECEFFIFDHAAFHQDERQGYYVLDSEEGAWRMGDRDEGQLNGAHKIGFKRGYFPVAPNDTQQDLRSEMVKTMIDLGMEIECHHHEVATAGQAEIDMRYQPLLKQADQVMLYKYVVKNVARRHGKTVTFMPKPLFQDNGSGMHVHQSLWKNGTPLFFGDRYANLSEMALWYIGGILHHAKSLLAFGAPTTNSYRRLVPGYEAPVNLVYSKRNRSAAVRIPMYSEHPKAKRLEFRSGDPSANPYLYFSALLMAGLDGIERKMDPGEAFEKDLFELSPEELKPIPTVPRSLEEAIHALEEDHAYLLKGNVFTKDVIAQWIDFKRMNDIDPVRLRPHPYEFVLSYDA